jgi:hypothetical protein
VREIDYHPFGEPKSWGYNSADRYSRSFDRDGRVREHSVGAATRSLTFDAASRITAQSEGAGSPNQWAFGYDNLDRLSSARNSAAADPVAGLNLAWTYDATGNRLSEARNGAAPIPNTIEATSNRLRQKYFWIALGRQSRATRVLHVEGRMAPHDSRADA